MLKSPTFIFERTVDSNSSVIEGGGVGRLPYLRMETSHPPPAKSSAAAFNMTVAGTVYPRSPTVGQIVTKQIFARVEH